VVALQVAIPMSYYLRSSDLDDERFAWRMFSDVRVKRCRVRAFEVGERGRRAEIVLGQTLHSSWIHSLERGRRRVVARFLDSRCAPAVTETQLVRQCAGVAHDQSVERYVYDCGRRLLHGPEPS
jgi:hypothetical protein